MREIAKTTAENLEETVNCMGNGEDMKYIVEKMANMHRTLNQSFTSQLVIPFVREMAKRYSEGRYDARNEATCKVCSAMWEAAKGVYGLTEDVDFRLPLI